jgi:hypothetical protein
VKAVLQVDLSFEQILSIIRQLSKDQKIQLSRALEEDEIDSTLTRLLNQFKTDEIVLDDIQNEVEKIRQEIYDQRKAEGHI